MTEPDAPRGAGRRLRRAAALVAAVLLGILVLVHLPPVRAAVLRYAVQQLRTRAGIELRADRLDYNLVTGRLRLDGVQLAAGGGALPFFAARRAAAALDASVLRGSLAFDVVEITDAVIRLRRGADGRTNLPKGSGDAAAADRPPVRIRQLSVDRFRVELDDEIAALQIRLPQGTLAWSAEGGRIALVEPAEVRVGSIRTTIGRLEGPIGFDGRDLRIQGVRVESEEGAAEFTGTLGLLRREPRLDLSFAATLDIARTARWGMAAAGPLPEGTLTVRGEVSGPFAAPAAALALSSDAVRWREALLSRLDARIRIDAHAIHAERFTGRLAGGDVRATARLVWDQQQAALDVSWERVDSATIASWIASGRVLPHGASFGRLTFTGPLSDEARWDAALRVQVDRAAPGRGRVPLPGETRVRVAEGRWRLEGAHLVGAAVPVVARLAGDFRRPVAQSGVAGRIEVGGTDVEALVDVLSLLGLVNEPDVPVARGTIRGELAVSGTIEAPSMSFTAASDGLEFAGGRAVVEARGRLEASRVRLDELLARQSPGPGGAGLLRAEGEYDAARGRIRLAGSLEGWHAALDGAVPASGLVNATFRLQGPPRSLNGDIAASIDRVAVGGARLGLVTADVRLDGEQAHLAARVPAFDLTADGRVSRVAPYEGEIALSAARLDLERLMSAGVLPAAPAVPIAGTAGLAIKASGALASWRDARADAVVDRLNARAGSLRVESVEPVRLRFADRRLHVDRLEIAADGLRVSASGSMATSGTSIGNEPPLIVTATGDLDAFVRGIAATGVTRLPIEGGSGQAAILAQITGTLSSPLLLADVDLGPGRVRLRNDLPEVTDLTLRARVRDEVIELQQAAAAFAGATLAASGRAPIAIVRRSGAAVAGRRAELHARLANVTPAVLQPFVPAGMLEQVAGALDASLDLATSSLDPADLAGELRLDRMEIEVASLPVRQREPTRIVLEGGIARVAAWDWTGEGATFGLRGQVDLKSREAALAGEGVFDLRLLTPFGREAGVATAGRLDSRFSVTGDLGAPRVEGTASLANGEVRLTTPRIVVTNLEARAVMSPAGVRIAEITGTANGAPLSGSASISLSPGAGVDVSVSTVVTGMPLEFPVGLRTEIDADVSAAATGRGGPGGFGGRLGGTVTIRRGAYREPLAVLTTLLAALRSRAAAAESVRAEAPTVLEAIQLDLRVITDEDIVIDNNVARAQVSADLRVIGTAARPALSGRAEIREGGQLFVGRNVFRVDGPGVLDFADPATIDPVLNVTATTRIASEEVRLRLTGAASRPSIDLQSDSPALGRAELMSLLLTGRTLDQLSAAQAADIGAALAGNLSGEVLGFAGRAVGLDTIRLGGLADAGRRNDAVALATTVDPTSRLTFGKSLGQRVDITYSQSLRDADAQTWIVEYLPARQLALRLLSGDDDLRSYEFRHAVTFGSALRAPAAARRETAAPRIAAVVLRGELGVPEDELRAQLRLRAGDRFDFLRWQEDRDRLRRFYTDRGRFAAEVEAGRAESAEGITLVYTIAPGPETRIRIAGAELPAAAVEEIRREWMQSPLDAFLLDAAAAIVQRWLARDGYLRPSIRTALEEAPGVRTLAITVDPGPRAAAIRFDVDADDDEVRRQVLAWLEPADRRRRAATDPAAFERELIDALRGRGYLRARVVVGPVRHDAQAVTVPLAITAGPRFRIGDITFEGTTRPTESLRGAIGLTRGDPYDTEAVEAARAQIEALYRRDGFQQARVSIREHVREPAVDLTVLIDEGPRQIIRDIQIAGHRSTDIDVIARALGLEIGAPLRADDWIAARRRVSDTGLFRRVDVSPEPIQPGAALSQTASEVPMRIRVTVEEWPALQLRYGLRLSEQRPEGDSSGRELGPGASADFVRRTLFGRPLSIGAAIDYRTREQEGRAFLRAPTLLGLPIESLMTAARSRTRVGTHGSYDTRTGVSWEQRVQLAAQWRASYSYRFEHSRTNVLFDPVLGIPPITVELDVARLNASTAWDTRDDPLDTTRGGLVSALFEYAPAALGSDIRFMKQLVQAYLFRPWGRAVVASAARFGVVHAFDDQQLISSERFFAGGAHSLRGVPENGLGNPDGSDAVLVLNQELRIPVFSRVRAVAFLDVANAFTRIRDVSLRGLAGSTGAGVRIETPFALLRADYGRVIWNGSGGRWSFGIGQTF